jgi:hypothetical protein
MTSQNGFESAVGEGLGNLLGRRLERAADLTTE